MSPRTTDSIREQYAALIEREDATRAKLAATRVKLESAREVDIAASADAALAGGKAPKRTELTLRHAEENLGVELDGIDEAVWRLQREARAAVGEGRDFPVFIPPNVPPDRAAVVAELRGRRTRNEGESDEDFEARVANEVPRNHQDAESIVREAHRQRGISLDRRMPRLTERPADLIAWVEAAYDAEDRQAEDGYERQAAKQRGHDAVEAVERAKREHRRRGLPAGSFSPRSYPGIVLPEHLAEFVEPISRSPFQKAREQLPSHEPEQNVPVAEPQPVSEADELRKREIADAPPAAAPDVEPIRRSAFADLPPEERGAARAAQIAEGEAVADRLIEESSQDITGRRAA